ncbi:MAG: pyridoxal phosphate-dependent aminotransferase [Halanaeroarchaeum sp.]
MHREPTPPNLSGRVRSLPTTPMRAMADLGAEQDREVVNLAFGDPDFDTPEHILDAATDAAAAGETHYTSNFGIPPLRAAIARQYADRGVPVDPDSEVAVTTGAIQGLAFAILAVADPGDEVVVPTPAWPSYFTQIRVAGASLVPVPLDPEDGFALDADAVAGAITADTTAVILSTPSNPTGQVFDAPAIERVVEAAAAHDAWVIADEVYWQLVFEGDFETVPAITDYDRVVVANSASKTYAMTGWRVGWLVGPEALVGTTAQLHQAFSTCASSLSQHGLLAALDGPQDVVEEMRTRYRERRDYVLDRVDEVPGVDATVPDGGFYVFADVRDLGESSLTVARRLVEEAGVVTAPGVGFGDAGEGHLRISFASSMADLEAAFDRIEAFARGELA